MKEGRRVSRFDLLPSQGGTCRHPVFSRIVDALPGNIELHEISHLQDVDHTRLQCSSVPYLNCPLTYVHIFVK